MAARGYPSFADTLATKPKDFTIVGHNIDLLFKIYTEKQCISPIYRCGSHYDHDGSILR
jgi:hypothetical protein